MATRLNPTNFGYQNFYSATLTADITSGSLTISLDTVPSPTSGILVIDPDSTTGREVILYTSKGASTVTCPSDGRGYSGSTAAAHLTGTTVIMAPIDKWFTALASGELSTDPLRTEALFDHVNSGCVWSGDAYGSTRNASMTSGVMYIGGRRITLSAVTARSFTASKDTYIDVADSAGDGTGTITYTEVANNAASPSLAANNVRIGMIVTGATNIAAASSIKQSGVDSLNNWIYPNSPYGFNSWKSWTPTLTNLTLGNGTLTARYAQVGKTVFYRLVFTLGSTSAVGTGPTFTLPTTPQSIGSSGSGSIPIGTAHYEDNGVTSVEGMVYMNAASPSSTVTLVSTNSAGTYIQGATVSATAPFTFGTGDEIRAIGSYESV